MVKNNNNNNNNKKVTEKKQGNIEMRARIKIKKNIKNQSKKLKFQSVFVSCDRIALWKQ